MTDHSPETRNAACPEHGDYAAKRIYRDHWTACPGCIALERAAKAEEARLRDAIAATELHNARIRHAEIPPRFVGSGFDAFQASTPSQRQALTIVRDYFETFAEQRRKGHGLILAGLPGTGKTMLASAGLQTVVDASHVRYTTCPDTVREVRATWKHGAKSSAADVFATISEFDLLVLDEMGVGLGTDGELNIIFDVIDVRYRAKLPTIFITNDAPRDLRTTVGDRSYDRLVETCRVVVFDWPSYRATARREALASDDASKPR